jgi:hypothetical protein
MRVVPTGSFTEQDEGRSAAAGVPLLWQSFPVADQVHAHSFESVNDILRDNRTHLGTWF